MNCQLVYLSKTGNIKKIAEAIASELNLEAGRYQECKTQ